MLVCKNMHLLLSIRSFANGPGPGPKQQQPINVTSISRLINDAKTLTCKNSSNITSSVTWGSRFPTNRVRSASSAMPILQNIDNPAGWKAFNSVSLHLWPTHLSLKRVCRVWALTVVMKIRFTTHAYSSSNDHREAPFHCLRNTVYKSTCP